MVWYEIVVALLGAFGGLAGVAAFIKSFFMLGVDKDAKGIKNEHAEIENLKEFIKIANDNYDRLSKQFDDYHAKVDKRITFFKEKFDKLEQEKEILDIATLQAYRCNIPPELMDCPVLKLLKEAQSCANCKHENS